MTNKSSAVFREIVSIDPWLNAKKLRGISHRELFSLFRFLQSDRGVLREELGVGRLCRQQILK